MLFWWMISWLVDINVKKTPLNVRGNVQHLQCISKMSIFWDKILIKGWFIRTINDISSVSCTSVVPIMLCFWHPPFKVSFGSIKLSLFQTFVNFFSQIHTNIKCIFNTFLLTFFYVFSKCFVCIELIRNILLELPKWIYSGFCSPPHQLPSYHSGYQVQTHSRNQKIFAVQIWLCETIITYICREIGYF